MTSHAGKAEGPILPIPIMPVFSVSGHNLSIVNDELKYCDSLQSEGVPARLLGRVPHERETNPRAGGGFAGLWSAVGAARKLDELGCGPEVVQVTLVNRDGFHNIRVRNYESDLTPVRVSLMTSRLCGVQRVEGEVTGIDAEGQTAAVRTASGQLTFSL